MCINNNMDLVIDLVYINVYAKSYQNSYICSEDIEEKHIFTSIKDHNSFSNERKILFNHPNLHLVNINAYTKFDRNPQINSQDIEHRHNSDVDQGP